jgi:hypothetical protein
MADKEYAPWSRETFDGLITSAVDSHVRVDQQVVPALNVGSIDKLSGKWNGVTVSDSTFLVDPVHEAVADNSVVLSPQRSDHEYIDMTGFSDLFIGLHVTDAGNYKIEAVMGPDSYNYANLSPVDAAGILRGTYGTVGNSIGNLLVDNVEVLVADVWNIFALHEILANQKLLQFRITNTSGGPSNITFAYMRII